MPTTNPVPSQDPSDLLFNAGKLDEVLNGTGNTFTDRLGTARRTVAGMNADFDAQLADAESDLNVYRADAAASAAEALGYLQTIRATSYGAYAGDPATDPLGNPPTVGDEYFNTTANLLKRWNGTTWQASDINTENLAASSGSSMVGYDGQTVQDVLDGAKSLQDYAALRAYIGRATRVYITGLLVTAKPAGIAGTFQHDPTDTTSADNGGTIIVGGDGRRWKRDFSGNVSVFWFMSQSQIADIISGASSIDVTVPVQTCIDTNKSLEILFPKGSYLCNIVVDGHAGTRLVGESQANDATNGVRLVAANPALPVVSFGGSSNVIASSLENFLLESKSDKTYSHAGIGLYIKALSPNVVWRCTFKKIFIRGFRDGMVLDCDINAGEIFDNEFNDIETVGCSRYSLKTKGVYNIFRKMFATQCSDFAFYNEGSQCIFDSVVGDGRMAFKGAGQRVTGAVIEAIYGAGTTGPAFEVNGSTSTFNGVTLQGVPAAKYSIGISVFGANQTINNISVSGVSPPTEAVKIFSGSSGTINTALAPSNITRIDTATPASYIEKWNFIGPVSDIFQGTQTVTKLATSQVTFPASQVPSSNPNCLDDYEEGVWTPVLSSSGTPPTVSSYLSQNGTYTKIGNRVFITCNVRATISAIGAGTPTITGLPFAAAANLPGISPGLCSILGSVSPTGNYINGSSVVFTGAVYTTNTSSYCTFSAQYEV